MNIKQLFEKNPRLLSASLFVLINSDNELVSFSKLNPTHSDLHSNLEVVNFDYVNITTSPTHLNKSLSQFETLPYGRLLIDAVKKLRADSYVLFIKYKETVGCYVITEKYYDDGSHKTETKAVNTNPDNINDTFFSDEVCDTFVKVCPTIEDVDAYLHSKFYLDLVEKRKRNRDAKGYKRSILRR